MAWHSFVAMGDSFTEGMSDQYPDGTYRGWADLVATRLAVEVPDFRYANLAVRGRLFDQVARDQVPVAMELGADLISFAAGGNDTLRRNFDPDTLIERLDRVVGELRGTRADVIIFRFADVSRRLPGRRLILPRVETMNRVVGEVAERHGAYLVDLWADEAFWGPLLWSVDRLHLNTLGHQRVAGHVLRTLGVEPDPVWLDAPPPGPALSWAARRTADARWVGQHFAPWIRRRLAGRSSGDHVTAKRPTLSPPGERHR